MKEAWREALRAGLSRARRAGRPVVAALREPLAETPDLLALYSAAEARGAHRFFAAGPRESFRILGLGAVGEIVSVRSDPCRDVRRRAQALLDRADPGVLLLGGLAFEPRPPAGRAPWWRTFANARFVLPEILLTRTPEASWLTRAARVRPGEDVEALARRAEAWLQDPAPLPGRAPVRIRPGPCGTLDYEEAAAEVIAAIRRDEAQKVVLARQETLDLTGTPRAAGLLQVLCASHPGSFTFAQGFGHETFLGATPERLIRRRGGELVASAVAGTVPRGKTAAGSASLARELHTSPKERAEHAFVVRAIAGTLGELCSEIEVPRIPELLESGAVQHLHTRIRGRLQQPLHVLEVVAGLHPTPAVGGTPRGSALELIRKHEHFDRGWYAGPLGWFSAAGDGDFVVALRCGLLSQERIRLFAGAGLVSDSDPRREARETALKLRALRDSLEARCSV